MNPKGAESLKAVEQEAFGGPEVKPYPKVPGTLKLDPVLSQLTRGFFPHEDGVDRHYALEQPPENISWSRIQTFSEVLLRRLDSVYVEALCERIETALFDAPGAIQNEPMQVTETALIDSLVTALVSDLLTTGFSQSFLRQHAQNLLPGADSSMSEHARLKAFLLELKQPKKSFTVVLVVQGNARALGEVLPSPEFKVTQNLEQLSLQLPEVERKKGRMRPSVELGRTNPHRAFVLKEVSAMDEVAAVREAYLLLDEALDLVWAERPDVRAEVIAAATKFFGVDGPLKIVSDDEAELRFRPTRLSAVSSSRQAPGFAARVRNATATHPRESNADAQSRSRRRIAGALRASRMAAGQPWLESSLTTLWTALEVLAHEQYGSGIIERVVRSTTPFIGSTKLRDLTDDLAAYLTWSGITSTPSFQKNFADVLSAPDGGPRPVALLSALANEKRMWSLVHMATPTPLLALRVHRFHCVIKDGKSAAERVLQTTQRVEWQLRRVYRMRNDVIHGAAFGAAGGRLLSHLQLYASSILGPITQLMSSKAGPATIEDAVAVVDGSFHVWLEWLRNLPPSPADLVSSDDRWQRMYQPPYNSLLS
jgi:hypothetical protein